MRYDVADERLSRKHATHFYLPPLWGKVPARYLAFKHEVALIRNSQGVPTAWISRRIGGEQIDYADETPEIRSMFSDALAKHGMTPRMEDAYQKEIPDLPPKAA